MSVLDLLRHRRSVGLHAADAPTEHLPAQPAPEPAQDEPHGIATAETLAALVARAQAAPGVTGAAPTLPHALAWRNGVQPWSEVIPVVPLTLPASIYEGLGGDEKTARDCGHCGALSGRGDWSWRYDRHEVWSCPSCQSQPEWRAPSLPGLRITTEGETGPAEMGIMARSLMATDPRAVRQDPDGRWRTSIPAGGRRRLVGPFETRQEAEAAYGYVLGAFAEAAGTESAA